MSYPAVINKKIFDCQAMPSKVREAFFKRLNSRNISNGCYVDWWIGSVDSKYQSEQEKIVDEWLVKHGAYPATEEDCGEEVIIKHWW